MKIKLSVLAFALALSGCGNTHFMGRPDLQAIENGELPAPDMASATTRPLATLLGPGDKVSIEVFGVGELSRQVTVDSSGTISYPLLGAIQVSGRSSGELAELIRAGLANGYVRDPRVTVSVVEVASQVVTVDGEVHRPGILPVVGRLTLMRAIARSGGTTEFARNNHVVLYRQVNGQNLAALLDLRAIREGAYADPEVYPGDVIVVSEDRARRLFGTVVQSIGILVSPLVTAIR